MKKVLLMIGLLLMVCSLSFSAEVAPVAQITSETVISTSTNEITEEELSKESDGISKGDSFMAAFGMGDSVAGGEAGMSSTAGAAGIVGNIGNVGASNLTSSQNTPYYR
ncbi:MAG: hypothetical protein ACRDAQ_03220 [Cetobacterium sp.]